MYERQVQLKRIVCCFICRFSSGLRLIIHIHHEKGRKKSVHVARKFLFIFASFTIYKIHNDTHFSKSIFVLHHKVHKPFVAWISGMQILFQWCWRTEHTKFITFYASFSFLTILPGVWLEWFFRSSQVRFFFQSSQQNGQVRKKSQVRREKSRGSKLEPLEHASFGTAGSEPLEISAESSRVTIRVKSSQIPGFYRISNFQDCSFLFRKKPESVTQFKKKSKSSH